MASDKEAANALKLQGNKAVAAHDWPTALDFYTQAIEKYDKEPAIFSNRAQVRPDEPIRAPPPLIANHLCNFRALLLIVLLLFSHLAGSN